MHSLPELEFVRKMVIAAEETPKLPVLFQAIDRCLRIEKLTAARDKKDDVTTGMVGTSTPYGKNRFSKASGGEKASSSTRQLPKGLKCWICDSADHLKRECTKACDVCGKTRHSTRSCYAKDKEADPPSPPAPRSEVARGKSAHERATKVRFNEEAGIAETGFFLDEAVPCSEYRERKLIKSDWLIDGGSSRHACTDLRSMSNVRKLSMPVHIVHPNGYFESSVVGTVRLKLKNDEDETVDMCLPNTLYIPSLPVNIFSQQVFHHEGGYVDASDDFAREEENEAYLMLKRRGEPLICVGTVWHRCDGKQWLLVEPVQLAAMDFIPHSDCAPSLEASTTFGEPEDEVGPAEEHDHAAAGCTKKLNLSRVSRQLGTRSR